MTASIPAIVSGAGLRHIQLYKLDSNGYPHDTESGATPYGGVQLEGAQAFPSTRPDPQVITHPGDDQVIAQDSLPPTAMETATLQTAKSNLTVDAILQGVAVKQVGDGNMIGRFTDRQGQEPQVTLFGWRQALVTAKGDPLFGKRAYFTRMYPKTRVIAKGSSTIQQGQPDTNDYNIIPTRVTAPPWGEDFALDDEGFLEASSLEFVTEFPPTMDSWRGNNTLVTFNLSWTPISVAKTAVWVNGVAATVLSVNTGAKTVTLSSAPANNAAVVAWYEASDLN